MASETFISSGRTAADEKAETATATPTSPLLTARNISHSYGQIKVVEGVSLEIRTGESVAIISPSGSGKSTLLRLLLRLEKPSDGETTLVSPPSDTGAAFQEDSLLPWLNVIENLSLLNRLHKKPVDEQQRETLLANYGLSEFKDYYPSQLSGGMKQKVALCRLLLYAPRFYILDESMANMDDLSRFALCDALHAQVAENHSSILFVTHNLTDALHLADRVLIGTTRPLRIAKEFKNPLPRHRDFHVRFNREFQEAVDQLRIWIGQH